MLGALDDLDAAVRDGSFRPTVEDEDVHTALERGLLERVGALGGKLRAGRSRNDQVATDLRLYLRDARPAGRRPGRRAGDRADRPRRAAPRHRDARHDPPAARPAGAVRPPPARARARLQARRRAASSTGTSGPRCARSAPARWPARRCRSTRRRSPPSSASTAPCDNSIDAVSDRDFVAEFCFVAALLGVHLSRLGEEICLWATTEFGWVELDDAYSTGSSIMPQKKNPDVAELARGKSGRLIGNLMALLTTLKGLPLAYDRDLQEDKEPVFDSVEQLLLVLPAMAGMVATLRIHDERMTAAAADRARAGHRRRRVAGAHRRRPFRDAHEIAGRLVRHCDEHGLELWEVDDAALAAVDPRAHARGPVGADGPRRAARPVDPRRHRAGPGRRAARRAAPTPRTEHAAWATGER